MYYELTIPDQSGPFINAIHTIPLGTTHLNLSRNNLYEKTSEELAQAFAALPGSVTTLDLSSNDLYEKTGAELAQAFAALPDSVTTLILILNDLYQKTGAELAEAFAALPDSLTSLDLARNELSEKTGAELAQAFAALPDSLTSLHLARNELYKKTGAELAQAFATLPASLATLDLWANGLFYKKTGAELAQAFAALPASVTTLDLGTNDLYKKTGAELAQIFAALPASMTTLDLSRNFLLSKTGTELAQAFTALPASMTTLDLSWNFLFRKTGTELAQAFAALPASLTTLNLSDNNELYELYKKTDVELAQAFATLPASVTTLNFSKKKFNPDNLLPLLPSTVQVIECKYSIVYTDSFWPHQLQQHVKTVLHQKGAQQLDFSTIQLTGIHGEIKDIDETCLNTWVSLLEKENTTLALLTAALLLEGRISNGYDENEKSNINAYYEKRTHDAITFYLNAAQDSTLKPIINFILWEMRLATTTASIQERLACLAIERPTDYMPSASYYKTPTHVMKMLFFSAPSLKQRPELQENTEEENQNIIILANKSVRQLTRILFNPPSENQSPSLGCRKGLSG